MSYFKYIKEENRYELVKGNPPEFLKDNPVFEQAAVLHTSEDVPIRLTRAYNLEDQLPFTDGQLQLGAEERGQELGDISGGNHIKDRKPEGEY